MLEPRDSACRPLTVFKIGGSLLNLPNLPHLIRLVLEQRPGNGALLVTGGGALADAVREWDHVHLLGDEAAHDLALAAMDLTASLLARFFPEARLVRSPSQVARAVADGAVSILCAGCFIKAAAGQARAPLEHSWRVTSDSIGAWTAEVLAAAELVLVKSVPLPPTMTPVAAAEAGLIDERFPSYAERVPTISWANARAPEPRIEIWQSTSGF
jgi:aspartokinase-like uncharacterized kinase